MKEIITKIIFEHLKFNNGLVNAEGLIESLENNLKLRKNTVYSILYRKLPKLTRKEAKTLANELIKYQNLLYKGVDR